MGTTLAKRRKTLRATVEGETSALPTVHSGVPQGSVMGPLLFLIYINDLENSVASNLIEFADDNGLKSSRCYSIKASVDVFSAGSILDISKYRDTCRSSIPILGGIAISTGDLRQSACVHNTSPVSIAHCNLIKARDCARFSDSVVH